MAISEKKMQIVIDNYFKSECNVNTSIRQAFEKGFRIGLKKGQYTEPKHGEWLITEQDNGHKWTHRKCSECGKGIIEPLGVSGMNYCPNCGADMRGKSDA